MRLKNPFTYIGTKNRKNSHPKRKIFQKSFTRNEKNDTASLIKLFIQIHKIIQTGNLITNMVSTIRYSANASSDHPPKQVPGILIIMNPKQPNLPTCSVTSTYLLFHLLSNPSLHLIANTTLGIIMTAIKISPKTLNHSILSTITNFDFNVSIIP